MLLLVPLALVLLGMPAPAADGFVAIHGGELRPGVRVDDFEMLDHALTNAEYREFVLAAKARAPRHWLNGLIPAGFENHPLIFVNRYDALAYLEWRTKKENRRYRLPTAAEFEYAARAGDPRARYPWGAEPPAGKANFDAAQTRSFAAWKKHLEAVKSYPPNPWKLFEMAGNVWQMVDAATDLATQRFVYRTVDPMQSEGRLGGGSWARAEFYLRCGVWGNASAGLRYPDVGFRPVREPLGTTHFQRLARRVVAANAGGGSVFLSWQQLPLDDDVRGYHVYRATRRDVAGERITAEPAPVTSFSDTMPPPAARVYYRIRAVGRDGREGPPSEWAGLDPSPLRSGLLMTFEPTAKTGGVTPVFGDLDGDGTFDAVLRLNNGMSEMSRDPGVPVELEAFTSFGRALWRRPLLRHDQCFGSANNVPFTVFDLDGDGRAEVIARLAVGDTVYLAVLNGMTGEIIRKTPWTPMATDFARSSTRIHMAIAYLDGKHPAIVTQTGLYENEVFDAFDANLRRLWQFRNTGETSGSGSHHVDIADLDGDGRDEVLDGTTALSSTGTVKWALYRQHPDIVAVKRIIPSLPGRQIYFAVESGTHAGAYVVDASTGKVIWKVNREDDPRWTHAHIGWAAKIWDGEPGMQMLTNRDGHLAKETVLFASDGKILMEPFPAQWKPVNWIGGAVRDLMTADGRRLARFTGKTVEQIAVAGPNERGAGSCFMAADLAGDFRDEVVCTGRNQAGDQAVFVYTSIAPLARRALTRTAEREYRLWIARNAGAGYPSYFE
jgi:rhamnogalacturonan endolyase